MLQTQSLCESRQRIAAAYDAQLIREAGHRLVDQLAAHFRRVMASEGEVLPWRPPPENIADALQCLATPPAGTPDRQTVVERFSELVALMLQRGHNLHDPRYIGHQVPAPVPLAGLFDVVGSATNQPMTVYDMGPWATAAEHALVEQLGEQIGWRRGTFTGMITHGGSLANLTALLTARNIVMPDSWEAGLSPAAGQRQPVLVVHGDAHYCVARAAGVLGLGTSQVVRVGLDDRRRMDPQQLDESLATQRRQNRRVVAVVACACSTPIGAFDPLEAIADVCAHHGVWLHVDAAHGGSACMSSVHQQLVAGWERADSIVWDAHKMLFMPALCAFVFFRDKAHQFEAFRQEAPYLFDPATPGLAQFDGGLRTVECTKRAAAFGLWGVWSLYGKQLFADLVDVTFDMGKTLYEKLTDASDFQPLHEPQCNIVVFRHLPRELDGADADAVGRFQLALRRRMIESGEFYIVSTKFDGVGALRVTVINPLTTPDHLDQLLESLRRHGRALLQVPTD